MRTRSPVRNLALLSAAAVFAVAASEAIVRILYGLEVLTDAPSLVFPVVPFTGKQVPSANEILIFEHDTSDPLINADGFRDRDFAIDKDGAFRIMALGDSVTFGRGVPLEQSYPKVLETLLNGVAGPGERVEVMNVAVGGYNSRQELELFRTVGQKYRPDLLVVGFVLNDCHPPGLLMAHWADLKKKQEARDALEAQASEDRGAMARVLAGSRLVSMIRQVIEAPPEPEQPGAPMWISKQCEIPENWAIVETAFRDLAAITKDAGIPVLVAIFPMLYDFDNYPFDDLHARVAREATANAFRVLDLLPALSSTDADRLRYVPTDLVHLNEEGHRLAAERIFEYLTNSGTPSRSLLVERPDRRKS